MGVRVLNDISQRVSIVKLWSPLSHLEIVAGSFFIRAAKDNFVNRLSFMYSSMVLANALFILVLKSFNCWGEDLKDFLGGLYLMKCLHLIEALLLLKSFFEVVHETIVHEINSAMMNM